MAREETLEDSPGVLVAGMASKAQPSREGQLRKERREPVAETLPSQQQP